MHHAKCQQIWKTQQWPQDWKRSVFIPIPKKGKAKECSSYRTIALISHASIVMLKIFQVRLQQYMNLELPDVQAGFRKGRGTRDQIANICWIIEYFLSLVIWMQPDLHISHASKVVLKILQARIQQYMNRKLPMFKLDLEKAEEPEIKLPTSIGSSKKQQSSKKHLLLLYWLCQSLWLCRSQQTVENSSSDGNAGPPYLLPEKSVCRSRSKS